MLFDYNTFIEELRENPDKKEIVERYTRCYGSQDGVDIYETVFYKEYLSKFKIPFKLVVPPELEDDFDWDLLAKLIVGSFSSEYMFVLDDSEGVPQRAHLYISANNDGKKITKDLSELWAFQIFRMYEIYVEEEMNFFSMLKEDEDSSVMEDEDESEAIRQEQETYVRKFYRQLEPLVQQPDLIQELKNQL